MTSLGAEKKFHGAISLFFLKTKRKSASLKPLIGLLDLVVGNLRPKKHIT